MRGTWQDVGAGHALEEAQVGLRSFMWAGRSRAGGVESASLSPSSQQPCPGVQLAPTPDTGQARCQWGVGLRGQKPPNFSVSRQPQEGHKIGLDLAEHRKEAGLLKGETAKEYKSLPHACHLLFVPSSCPHAKPTAIQDSSTALGTQQTRDTLK